MIFVVFELLYETSVIIANIKLLANLALLLAARVIIFVGEIHPFFASPTTPRRSVAFVGGLAFVRHENHIAFFCNFSIA